MGERKKGPEEERYRDKKEGGGGGDKNDGHRNILIRGYKGLLGPTKIK